MQRTRATAILNVDSDLIYVTRTLSQNPTGD
jgi:hypothetical protein